MRPLVVVPAFNEEDVIVEVIGRLGQACPDIDYVIVNDGSEDGTRAACAAAGYPVISLPTNAGLAEAVRTGMQYALRNGYDAVIQFDADGQHPPQRIRDMVSTLGMGYDIVIGSRYLHGKKPSSMRAAGNRAISWVLRLVTGQRITDPTSGFRAYNHRVVRAFARDSRYAPEPDTLCHLMRRGARVKEIEATMAPRKTGRSYLTAFASLRYMLRVCVSLCLPHDETELP